jgi:DNA-binding NarL/FixJ family response regulator
MTATTPVSGHPAMKAILIVDDHPLMRRGLTALIESEPDLAVCGEAATCKAALTAVRACLPDLLLVDLELDGSHGLDLIKTMKTRHPKIPALVLSMHDESVYAERSLRAGAMGYVTKQQLDETLLLAMRRLLNGETYVSNKLEARLAAKYLGGQTLEADASMEALSDRQLQVFRLIGEGRSTRQIAITLALSVKTIESHLEHIKQKLVLDSGTELIHRASRWVDSAKWDK